MNIAVTPFPALRAGRQVCVQQCIQFAKQIIRANLRNLPLRRDKLWQMNFVFIIAAGNEIRL
jgi:hypothetical protein